MMVCRAGVISKGRSCSTVRFSSFSTEHGTRAGAKRLPGFWRRHRVLKRLFYFTEQAPIKDALVIEKGGDSW